MFYFKIMKFNAIKYFRIFEAHYLSLFTFLILIYGKTVYMEKLKKVFKVNKKRFKNLNFINLGDKNMFYSI